MAQKPETVFRQRIRPHLENLPNTAVFAVQQVAIRGTPDFLLCVNGLFIAIELKKDDKSRPSPLQKYQLDRITRSNGIAIVCNPQNWDEVYAYLQGLACQTEGETVRSSATSTH